MSRAMSPSLQTSAARCPALFISAPASGQGKTTVTAALARLHRLAGRRVIVFKTGPDFLDPMILEVASGEPVDALDLWMVGEHQCRALLHAAAMRADLILIEGVMGLFDGTPSGADLARLFGVPVLAVIDGSAMAQTFAAIAHGLATFQESLPFSGVLANRIGSDRHAEILRDSLPESIHWYGAIKRSKDVELPSRHLGLLQSSEITDLDERLNRLAEMISATGASELPTAVTFVANAGEQNTSDGAERLSNPPSRQLSGVRIGIAKDQAFSFIYPANLTLLKHLGAELVFFSPLHDKALPDVESVYLPGGYPELFATELAANSRMKAAIQAHVAANKPLIAECGGMLYLSESLTDLNGNTHAMVGVLRGKVTMQSRLKALAMQSVALPEGSLRGHTYHHSCFETDEVADYLGVCPNYARTSEAVYRKGNLYASYIHHYFPSATDACVALFDPQ
ncbi:cobyrinate a,c-diamide synthase [Neptunomonas antarctica]|uniref:Cobyrinate a,c-diamide synthase n=1 Tax=Neptunomonas antarctica TaxID=619304 RepID=A0A1N7NEK8_9GAMM|nr:cobyrinate a,c-diamide synthase [Neptunomonas antarctica]SIS96784.1 hydrogenobyrinic acid a,c-diamide synthase (glutamine-hydrolysing) /cobyrinate a,c-diamide synthase [Neptunomonas antarctica]